MHISSNYAINFLYFIFDSNIYISAKGKMKKTVTQADEYNLYRKPDRNTPYNNSPR